MSKVTIGSCPVAFQYIVSRWELQRTASTHSFWQRKTKDNRKTCIPTNTIGLDNAREIQGKEQIYMNLTIVAIAVAPAPTLADSELLR